jgi:hypothetical protein
MLKRFFIGLSFLLIVGGCGDSSTHGTTLEQLNKKDGILIVYRYPKTLCKVSNVIALFKDLPLTKNNLLVVESNEVTCEKYGREETHKSNIKDNLDDLCSIVDDFEFDDEEYELGSGDHSCVLGIDWSLLGL